MPDEIMQVADIIKKGKAVLFAGAGVSAEAGLKQMGVRSIFLA